MTFTLLGTAVITGGSSGIGALYADRLARRGHDLILVARSKRRLEELASRIVSSTGKRVETVAADLTDPRDLADIEKILRDNSSVTMLVNNAGLGATTPLLDSPVHDMSAMIALNVDALTRLTYAAAPGFVARGAGTIINISSIVALAPEILNGVYSATKAFVLVFSQSLQHELTGKGVRVQVVLPGATATEFWNAAGSAVEHLPPGMVMPAASLVDAALAGLDQGEVVTIPSLPEAASWDSFEAARAALLPGLSLSAPAGRYGVAAQRPQEAVS